MQYVAVPPPRFDIANPEKLDIPARHLWPMLAFVPVWLFFWTVAGFSAMTHYHHKPDMFLLAWLGMWAIAWCAAFAFIVWSLAGVETLRVLPGGLETCLSIGPLRRVRLYNTAHISRLMVHMPPRLTAMKMPLGSIQFNYGARTYKIGLSLDDAEASLVVNWLRDKLPSSAFTDP